jgi:hypothetical protein
MRKLIATFSVLAALFSAPVVYADEACNDTMSVREADMAMEEVGAHVKAFYGREAAGFLQELAKALTSDARVQQQLIEAAGPFASLKVYYKEGIPTVLVILFDANGCATKTADVPIPVIAKIFDLTSV